MTKCGVLLFILLQVGILYAADLEIKFSRAVLPVLAGESINHVGYVRVIKKELSANQRLTGLSYSFSGTTCLNELESLALYECNSKGIINKNKLFAISDVISENGDLRINIPIHSDTCYWAFSVKVKRCVSLSSKINFNCTEMSFNNKVYYLGKTFAEGLQVGIPLRKAKQDGVNTSRIPGLITSTKGTLMAIYDARWDSGRDLQGDIDIALNRSEDGGQSWQPMQRVLDMKEWGNLPEKYNGVSDACILCDKNTGTIYIAGLWMHGVLDAVSGKWVEGLTQDSTRWIHQWISKGSQPGFGVKETAQFLIIKSEDDGKTWSAPINITSLTKKKEWWLYAPAPGHGITLVDGTLVFPTQGRDENGIPFSNITYSKDGGKTWIASAPAYSNTTECMAVQLDNGDIMLNMRDNRNRGVKSPNGRRVCVTSDLGKTWREHTSSYNALIEPTCMASIHKHVYSDDQGRLKSLLVFFNPNSYNAREKLTLKFSFDDGKTWPEKYWVMVDEWGGAGYSCITSIDENTLGIIYEGSGAHLVFQQIKLKELF
jgi:sialidase-1